MEKSQIEVSILMKLSLTVPLSKVVFSVEKPTQILSSLILPLFLLVSRQ